MGRSSSKKRHRQAEAIQPPPPGPQVRRFPRTVLWAAGAVLIAGLGVGAAQLLTHRSQPEPVVVAGDGVRGPKGMMWVPGGEFRMGSDHQLAQRNERPAHPVRVHGFWMDEAHVTNAQFRAFVEATGYKTTADLIAAATKKPGSLNFASAGVGSGTHINAEKFNLAAGINALHIPYKGTPEALTETMTGRVTYFFSPISAALSHIREGKLVALGVSSAKRSSLLANVPTIAESGLQGFEYNLWVGMFAPAGVPADVVEKINRDVNRVLREPDVRDRMTALGAEAMQMTPAEFDKFVRMEMDDAAKVVKAAGIKVQ